MIPRLEFTANSKGLAYGQRKPSPHPILRMTALAMLVRPINMTTVLRRLDVEDARPHIRNSRKRYFDSLIPRLVRWD